QRHPETRHRAALHRASCAHLSHPRLFDRQSRRQRRGDRVAGAPRDRAFRHRLHASRTHGRREPARAQGGPGARQHAHGKTGHPRGSDRPRRIPLHRLAAQMARRHRLADSRRGGVRGVEPHALDGFAAASPLRRPALASSRRTRGLEGHAMASFTINPLTAHTGVEVVGLDFTQPIDTDDRAGLRRAFAEHHVLVMREQHFTPDQFEAAAQVFGEIQLHDKRERHVPGHPGVDYVSNDQIENGRRIIPGETFHTDHSNHPSPPKATMLFAVELPSRGGDTQYVNMHDAYDDLPAETKQRIDGLKAVHVYQSKYSPRPLGQITEQSRSKLPPPGIHPLVRTHPENGRKALFLNPVRMESIIGMEDNAALALIEELMRHATQKKYEYRHKWRH